MKVAEPPMGSLKGPEDSGEIQSKQDAEKY